MFAETTKKQYTTPNLEIQPIWVLATGISLPVGTSSLSDPFGDFMDAPTEQ